MDILTFTLQNALGFYITWVGYLACMALKRERERLSVPAKVMGYPLILAFIVADAVLNTILFSILFAEPPHWHKKEMLVTGRLKRHARHGNGWRSRLARFICHTLLDTFDPSGRHC